MAVFQSFLDVFKRNSELEWMYDMEFIKDKSERAYLKRMAVDSVINFVARSVSQSEFRYNVNGKKEKNNWNYKLNVRPNTDNSSTLFWQKVVYKLIYDNEVLVIMNDSKDLLIADNFVRNGYANYEDTFDSVTVKGYEFGRTFKMNEVWHMEYNNNELDNFIDGLFGDYGEIFGRMIEVNLRNNQIRGKVKVDMSQAFAKDDDGEMKQTKLQRYIDKMVSSLKNNSVAVFPEMKGLDFIDLGSGKGSSSQSIEELTKLKKSLIDDVARVVGVPPSLIHGDIADLEANMEAYNNFCLKPLLEKIRTELQAKIINQSDYNSGHRISILGIDKKDMFDNATNIDKLISSGFVTKNEAREPFGLEPVTGGDKFIITKNYQAEGELKGGEDE